MNGAASQTQLNLSLSSALRAWPGAAMSNKQVMAAHLARKVQHTVSRKGEALPQDLLVSGVSTAFAGATGFPEAADSVAYEPTQGLLAVSCA